MKGQPRAPARSGGTVLAVVLVLLAAGMAVSAAVATSATLALGMAERTGARLRAHEAAEAGIASALQAGEWSAARPWSATGALPEGGHWQVVVVLDTARVDPSGGPVEWLFEITSRGRAGTAETTLVQAFRVSGALPGVPGPTWWRHAEPAP